MSYESYKHEYNRDDKGICIPKYGVFTVRDSNSPAQQILKDPSRVNETFYVKDAENNIIPLSAEWIAGFMDGEGTLTFFFNKNDKLIFGYQIQSAFILVQGEVDYLLLTAIANFFGCGSVNVNRTDKTSVRYQYRIVDPTILTNLIIPFFEIVKLRTKKGDEFVIWAECTKFLKKNQANFNNQPNLAIDLVNQIKFIRYEGASTKKTKAFIKTCNSVLKNIQKYKNKKGMV